jgi:hypothetical protein
MRSPWPAAARIRDEVATSSRMSVLTKAFSDQDSRQNVLGSRKTSPARALPMVRCR